MRLYKDNQPIIFCFRYARNLQQQKGFNLKINKLQDDHEVGPEINKMKLPSSFLVLPGGIKWEH